MSNSQVRPAPYPGPAGIIALALLISAAVFAPRLMASMGIETASDWIDWWPALIPAGLAAGLATFTLGKLLAAVRERQRAREQPNSPWLWRARWRRDGIRNNSGGHAAEAALWAGVVLAMAVVVDVMVVRTLGDPQGEDGFMYYLVAGLVTLVAVFLLARFIRALRTWLTWRRSHLHLKRMPVRLGETWRGQLDVPAGRGPVTIKFGVYRSVRTRNNHALGLQGAPLWETEPAVLQVPAGATGVTLEFKAPADRPVSDWSRRDENTHWQVTVLEGKERGFQYELPVFR